jgi:hypothetical protein
MAEYLVASGSRRITQLTTVSGISGSTSMPIVMGGSTVQVSHTDFLNSTVFNRTLLSGSAQVIQLLPNGTVSGSSQVSFNGISDKPTLVSSSQQVLGYGIFTTTASFNAYTSSNDGRVNSLTSATASYATTSSNRFIGNQTITGSLLVTGSVNIRGGVTGSSFTGSFRGDGSGLTGVITSINTGSFATTGSNIFRGNQTITGSVGVSGSVNANEFQLGSGITYLENTAYWLKGNPTVNDGEIGFTFSSGNTINNIQSLIINEVSSDINGTAGSSNLSWFNGLVNGSVITMQGVSSSPSNLNQTITLSVNSILDNGDYWTIGVDVLDYQPVSPLTSTYEVYSFTYTTTTGDGPQYTITSDESRLLVSSSNTQFSGDVNVTGSITSQLFLNPQTITQELIVPSGFNGMLIGPISLEGGMGVSSGSVLVVM